MEFLNLSGVIITQNEKELVLKPIQNIYNYVDEIIILDGGSQDNSLEILKNFKSTNDSLNKLRIFQKKFDNHFGDQKNFAINKVRGFWVLNLDADEYLDIDTLEQIKIWINKDETTIEVYAFPRLNILNGKETEVWPDYQLRLFRSYCRYIYAVHEELVGFDGNTEIKYLDDRYKIYHHKSQNRQDRQNAQYEIIIQKKLNFMKLKKEKDEES